MSQIISSNLLILHPLLVFKVHKIVHVNKGVTVNKTLAAVNATKKIVRMAKQQKRQGGLLIII